MSFTVRVSKIVYSSYLCLQLQLLATLSLPYPVSSIFSIAAPKGLIDTNHELLTVGLCNMFGSCVQAMPSSGAFTRYAISTACGLKTPMANLYLGRLRLHSVISETYLRTYTTFQALLCCWR